MLAELERNTCKTLIKKIETNNMDRKLELLCRMIEIPSPSREEKAVADMLESWLLSEGLPVHRLMNNLWLESCPAGGKPTILLNAHIDTVKAVSGWSSDPFTPAIVIENSSVTSGMSDSCWHSSVPGCSGSGVDLGKEYGLLDKAVVAGTEDIKITGLGANDDGGSVVAMIEAYRILVSREQSYRLVLALTAEEEVSGKDGIELVLPEICGEIGAAGVAHENIALAIVGEPTGMQMAVAEKGLMVLDCTVFGKSGHAARNEGVNAIYKAWPIVKWFAEHEFEKVSKYLGPVKMSVTQIQAGTQHNVVPDKCSFVVDVRTNDCYTNKELLAEIQSEAQRILLCGRSDGQKSCFSGTQVRIESVRQSSVYSESDSCHKIAEVVGESGGESGGGSGGNDGRDSCNMEIKARSTRLGSSHIDAEHPVVKRGLELGLKCFGSPTLSNQALLRCPSLKIGPGDSARSHTANEFILSSEIERAVEIYVNLLDGLTID